jgi:hypothetical protein
MRGKTENLKIALALLIFGSIQRLEFGIWRRRMPNHALGAYAKTPNEKVSRYLFTEQKFFSEI